ncbi:phosphatidate cytidylyltransferase [Candidatus Poribacteria bacterium]|nr:phosphatidate cytidylyltransferase [Candidatus Poribacteria bacterium]
MLKEHKRKIIHLIGLLIPICYYFFREEDKIIAVIILFALTTIYFFLELLRLTNKKVQRLFLTRFSSLLRTHEKQKITGTGYYLLSSLLSVLFFEKELAIACLSFLVLGDMFAAIIGTRFGRTKIWANKSLEGSFACFAVCLVIGLLIAWLFPEHLTPKIVAIGALTATIVELLPLGIDDNLTIPLISGLVMQILISVAF